MNPNTLTLPHGSIALPAFLPDGTQGVVRGLDATDLVGCGIQALQMNAYHLMLKPGSSTVTALGGLHRLAAWQRPIFTDSGGFQIYSLIRQNAKLGSINEKGAVFRPRGREDRKFRLTPEKSVQLQWSYGSDMLICLDDCTHVDDPPAEQEASVRRTIAWAGRTKQEYERQRETRNSATAGRHLLMGVIQGGNSRQLRQECADQLMQIGFDAFGYGGWPLDSEGRLLAEMLSYVRDLVPHQFPLHALGVGHPASVLACARMGYSLFDSTMPTRDARNGRLLIFTVDPGQDRLDGDSWFRYLYMRDKKHRKHARPLSEYCDCHCCRSYSLGYLHHLHNIGDTLYQRLATMHNLRFMTQLMANIRQYG